MITACLLNHHRPDLLKSAVLPVLETCDLIDEIIISHGRQDTAFDHASRSCDIVHRQDHGEINDTHGLSRRWLCWQQARNPAVLSLDDDVLVPHQTIARLYQSFQQDPRIIHSLAGRGVGPGMRYLATDHYGDIELALTGIAVLPRTLGRECLEHAHLMDDFVRENSRPLWNGEDIFASLLSMKLNGRLNRCLRLPHVFLHYMAPSGSSVSEWDDHYAYRTKFLCEAAKELGLSDRLGKSEHGLRVPDELRPDHMRRYLKSKALNVRFRFIKDLLMPRYKSPGFMILGGEECGVGALYQSLGEHPDVRALSVTRPDHFNKSFRLGCHSCRYDAYNVVQAYEYRKLFPRVRSSCMTGEASETYLYSPEVPLVISSLYPKTRFIVLTRDPVQRAWAAYTRQKNSIRFMDQKQSEKLRTFSEAIRYERERLDHGFPMLLSSCILNGLEGIGDMKDDEGEPLRAGYRGYLSKGRFAFWLKHWHQFFEPDQFLVLSHEELLDDPVETVRRAHAFLDLEPRDCSPYAPVPQTSPGKTDQEFLTAYFSPYNQELYQLLGKTFAWTQ